MIYVIAVIVFVFVVVLLARLFGSGSAHAMAASGDVEGLKKLLAGQHSAAVEPAGPDGEQPIHAAAAHGQAEALRVLLQYKANPSARCEGGGTPLIMAVHFGERGTVECLLDAGADIDDPDDTGVTPLHYAVSRGHEGLARLLLERGAQPNFKDAIGHTPLDLARELNNPALVTLLEAHGGKSGTQVRMRDLPPPKTAGGAHRVPVVMPIPRDAPAVAQARERARAEAPELERLFREHPKTTAVKYAADPNVPHELVWLDVDTIENGEARGVLVSDPIGGKAERGAAGQVPLTQITDWVVMLNDGSMRGGYGLLAMLAYAKDEYGALPASLIELEQKLNVSAAPGPLPAAPS